MPTASSAPFVFNKLAALALLASLVACSTPPGTPNGQAGSQVRALAATSYYVDCSAPAGGAGSQTSPWNALSSVNSRTFSPGDTILFKRGSTCLGMLSPGGSGTSGAPISLDAYGTGAKPIINGGSNPASIRLFNQQYWQITHLETVGGNPRGVYIGGDASTTFHYFRITDVTARDVGGTASDKETGLVVVAPGSANTAFDDVVIDGVTASGTQQWAGIIVGTDNFESLGYSGSVASSNVTVRNSTVSNVYGDGIVLYHVNGGLIETSVAHDVGKIPTTNVGTPNAIWTWWCSSCTVQYNEGYNVSSPGIDGGVYDIDYWNVNNTVQYNYGHDAQGYCVAVFGARGQATVGSVVRYNVCANNGRTANGAKQGDFYLSTWDGGSLDGVKIFNNTSRWTPSADEPALVAVNATYSGTNPRLFKNNLISSDVDKLVWTSGSLALDNNLYWYTGGANAWWGYGGTWSNNFSAYQSASGQDAHGKFADPLLSSATPSAGRPASAFTLQSGSPAVDAGGSVDGQGTRDFSGNSVPQGAAPDIGANELTPGGTGTGTNLVANGSFENGLTGWSQWWDSGVNASNVGSVTAQGGHTGTARLVHWSASAPYRQYTAQTVTGLSSGTYRLQAWVQNTAGLSELKLGAKNCNGSGTQERALPTNAVGTWTLYSTDVTVSGSTCEVFVWTVSPGGGERWSLWDDVSFTRQ